MITRQFEVYLNPSRKPPLTINVNQYDQGEKWVFTILNEDGTAYTPTTCAIVGRKSDGNGIAVNGTVENGKAVIMETEQMTASAGKAVFELSVDGLTHGTANFYVLVEKKPIEDAVMSDSDLSLIQEALEATPYEVRFEVEYIDEYTANATCNHTYAEIMAVLDEGKDINAYAVIKEGSLSGVEGYVKFAKLPTIDWSYTDRIYFYSATGFSWTPSNQYLRMIRIFVDEVGSPAVHFSYIKMPYKVS